MSSFCIVTNMNVQKVFLLLI
uniref:Uncharacterized protein n=1 Tax=Anguilla anguilla TaxID=7936 RepID=A0A0E9XLS8_ANGAN